MKLFRFIDRKGQLIIEISWPESYFFPGTILNIDDFGEDSRQKIEIGEFVAATASGRLIYEAKLI